jgi:hypothetical protein
VARFSFAAPALAALLAGLSLDCGGGSINVGDSGPDADADTEACPGGCPDAQVCHDGACVDPASLCDGVSCPLGQQCYLGQCISGNPCDDMICPNEGDVCQHGECVSGEADTDGDGVRALEDCDDRDPAVHPGAEEQCNGVDDDCDGAIDETSDLDGDGFPGCEHAPEAVRDCNDDSAWVFPGAAERCDGADDDCDGEADDGDPGSGAVCGETVGACEAGVEHCVGGEIQCVGAIFSRDETCNGADDDCNGTVDDGTALDSCLPLANATIGCVGGACTLTGCTDGWADLDGVEETGCETPVDPYPDLCASAVSLGNIPDDGTAVDAAGTIAPAGDVDWFSFVAQDTGGAGCDTFALRVVFTTNPGGAYRFEVHRGSCDVGAECGDAALETYDYYANFRDVGAWGAEVRGECPCTATPSPGNNVCVDNGATYMLRVYRADGGSSGDQYMLHISNG